MQRIDSRKTLQTCTRQTVPSKACMQRPQSNVERWGIDKEWKSRFGCQQSGFARIHLHFQCYRTLRMVVGIEELQG